MQIKIFTLPVLADIKDMDELNLFLRANKVIDIRKELAMVDGNHCWTFCITYMPSAHPVEEQASATPLRPTPLRMQIVFHSNCN